MLNDKFKIEDFGKRNDSSIVKKILIRLWTSFSKRDKNLWVFGEWFGERCCDNAMAFANYVAENHPEIRLVWVAEKGTDLSLLHSKIQFAEMDTKETTSLLKQAGVAVMIQGFEDFSSIRENYFGNALSVNLWHGVAWKKIGYDVQGKQNVLTNIRNCIRNWFLASDLYLATSEENARVMCSAYGVSSKSILMGGYPRNAIFYDQNLIQDMRKNVLQIVLKMVDFPSPETVKIIAYMPTFRDHNNSFFSFTQLENDDSFIDFLNCENIIVIQKAHFVTGKREKAEKNITNGRILNINNLLAQELLAAADMLITDYSSCFFDFLLLDRPIIHYLYDYNYYRLDDRGLYYDKEEVVAGDVAENIDELKILIRKNLHNPDKNKELRQKRRKVFMTYETENACQILFEKIRERQR